jgi:hypothetical protein
VKIPEDIASELEALIVAKAPKLSTTSSDSPMEKLNSNNVSLAGEFAVLSQLVLRGYDANMTLGRTKGVDILLSDPRGRMLKLEVKTNYRSSRSEGSKSKDFGQVVSSWIMNEKHEQIYDPSLFYCFVNISRDTKTFKFYIVPSAVVADYVKRQHHHWLAGAAKKRKDSKMRVFRFGRASEKYPIPTPTVEQYEDNWEFKAN